MQPLSGARQYVMDQSLIDPLYRLSSLNAWLAYEQ